MTSWRTNIGGAVFGLGTFLMGAATYTNLSSPEFPSAFIKGCILGGFILQGVGGFLIALFARDSKVSDEQAGAGVQLSSSPPAAPAAPKP